MSNYDREEINLSELERKFGSYDCGGATYYATRQIELSKHVLAGSDNEPERYIIEGSVPGYDEEGNPVEICVFSLQLKGEEMETENLN